MIRPTPKHWFESVYPKLEPDEEEIFFQHPFEDIKCNQLGALYYDEERYIAYDMVSGSVVRELETYNKIKVRIIGSKHRVIWECYHGQKLESGVHFTFRNGNPLDLTPDNLLALNKLDSKTKQKVSQVKSLYVKNSVERLVKMEQKYTARGLDVETLHALLHLPNWLSGARKRWTGPVPKAYAKKS